VKVVTAAVMFLGGRILLARRATGQQLAGKWEFPGGKVEEGETLAECLARELREELGIDAQIGEILGESIHRYEGGVIKLIALEARASQTTFALSVHDEIVWARPSELLGFDLAPADIPIAARLASRDVRNC
jgi:8-oxo-dGTP diphosphatase